MKKFALVFLFWMAFLPLIAQFNYVTVQGYVTDSANGSPIPNHPVTIQVDSSSGFFYYNVVYTWSTGLYIDTIVFNTSIPTSNVFVSTFDCNQNMLQATLPFGPGNQNLTHNFQICNTPPPCHAMYQAVADTGNPLNIYFYDYSTGNNIVSWLWDFGDSTTSSLQNPIHTYSQAGTYYVCLTIYNQDWTCQDTWCTNITVGGNSNCVNYFLFTQNSLTVSFTGTILGSLPATYSWSFGDGTGGTGQNITHTYASQGMYFVSLTTVTDSTNCTYSSGQTIQVGDSSQFNQVYGQAFEFNFPLSSGLAMIFSLDTLNTLPYNDISLIDSMGIFSFPYVPQGNLVIWVIPTDSSDYLPTYYGDVITWQQATVISLGIPNNPYNIHLVQGTDASVGPGGINGHINNSNLKNSLADKIRMILMNEQGNPLEFRNVSASGDFDFSTLGYGVYFLRAELPGCTSDLVRVEITAAKPVVNVVMTYSGNHMLGINDQSSFISGIACYPNPFRDFLSLSINSKENAPVQISLCDLTGREAISKPYTMNKGSNTIRINTAALQSGVFILHITTADGNGIINKVIKVK